MLDDFYVPSVAEAYDDLETAALRYVLAVEEEGSTSSDAQERYESLKVALYVLQKSRAQADEYRVREGKPCLVVVGRQDAS